MTDPDRDAMHRVFAELRDVDRRSAPDFDAVLRHPRGRYAAARSLRAVAALAAVLVVAAVVVTRRPQPVPSGAPLSAWRAPTDVLLRTPGVEVLRSVPAIGSSVVDQFGTSFHDQPPESR
jgi:hypothetical protein